MAHSFNRVGNAPRVGIHSRTLHARPDRHAVKRANANRVRYSLAYIQAWTEVRKVGSEMDGLLLTGALNPAELGKALQGTGLRQQGLLNQLQESSTKSVLPAAIQTGP